MVKAKPHNYLDKEKIAHLGDKKRSEVVYALVRGRVAVPVVFVPKSFDMAWLHAMGYLYEKEAYGEQFYCTSENEP